MKMTEFYDALAEATEKLGLTWEERGWGRGYLRARRTGVPRKVYCPITAVYERQAGVYCIESNYLMAAERIGLKKRDAKHIAASADSDIPHRGRRKKLEQAMGLSV